MQQPLQITIKDVPHSPAVEEHIRLKAEKLSQFCEKIISCHIVVDLDKKHQHQGKLFNVHIRVHVPNREFVSTRNSREDLWMALRDAFKDMEEELQFYDDMIHHKVKNHQEVLDGEIVRLFGDYGFILARDGEEYYFNAYNMVKPGFARLKVGTPVHFIEGNGFESPQACRIRVKRRSW